MDKKNLAIRVELVFSWDFFFLSHEKSISLNTVSTRQNKRNNDWAMQRLLKPSLARDYFNCRYKFPVLQKLAYAQAKNVN